MRLRALRLPTALRPTLLAVAGVMLLVSPVVAQPATPVPSATPDASPSAAPAAAATAEPTAMPTAVPTAAPEPASMVWAVNFVKTTVFEGPSTDTPAVADLRPMTYLQIVGYEDVWAQIYNPRTRMGGYVP